MQMYNCDKCGLCCQSLSGHAIYQDLDRGDGVCKYYDVGTKLCSIYNERPLICNVDLYFETVLKGKISLGEYYKANYAACASLKIRGGAK